MGCGNSQPSKPNLHPGYGRDSVDLIETDISFINDTKSHPNNNSTKNASSIQTISVTKTTAIKPKPERKPEPISIESLDDEQDSPKPSWRRKSDLIPEPAALKEIDSHVAKTPASACSSIRNLTSFLVINATTPLQKLRALHRWVTTNIQYDTEFLVTGKHKDCDADSVLKNRTSVCQGYSELFAALCREVHIQVKIVSGYGKGYGHRPEEDFNVAELKSNHAWNAVFLDGEWRLLDCTWDAGTVDANKNFKWRKGDHYFLTDPEVFIDTHFPMKVDGRNENNADQWQLLRKPVDATTFFKRIKVEIFAYESGLELVSHKDTMITVDKQVDLSFRRHSGIYQTVSGHLTDTADGSSCDQHMYIFRNGANGFKIHVRPPKSSVFKLNIYGSIEKDSKENHSLCTYYLKCTSVASDTIPYAKHHGLWGPKPNFIDFGFAPQVAEKFLYESNDGEIDIKIPFTKEINVLCRLETSEELEVEGAVLTQSTASDLIFSVRMPEKGFYRFIIFAADEHRKHKDVVYLMIECKAVPKPFQPLPTGYSKQCTDLQTLLLEPRNRIVPANSDVTFRFTSDLVAHVQIGGSVFRDGKNGNMWNVTVHTPEAGKDVTIFAGKQGEGVKCLYTFKTT